MDDSVQLVEAVFVEGQPGEARPVEPVIRQHHFGAKGANDLLVHRLAWPHKGAAQFIGFDHLRAQFAQPGGNRTLAAAQAPGKTDSQHAHACVMIGVAQL